MITKFDKFLSSAVGTSIMRDTNDVQRAALARIVRVCGKLPLKNVEESIKSVYDKMLVRSLSFLADDDLVREEALKYDQILSTFGNSANNSAIPVTDQFIGTADGNAIGVATLNNGKGKSTPSTNVVESTSFTFDDPIEVSPELGEIIFAHATPISETQNYMVTIDDHADGQEVAGWLIENGFTMNGKYPFGVINVTGPAGVLDIPGAAIHAERAFQIMETITHYPGGRVQADLEEIQALPVYAEITGADGYAMTSSAMQIGRLTLQFGAPGAHRYIVYQNGAVRSLTAVNAATNMKRFADDLITIEDWTIALTYVASLIRKKIAKAARAAGTVTPAVDRADDLAMADHGENAITPAAIAPVAAAAEAEEEDDEAHLAPEVITKQAKANEKDEDHALHPDTITKQVKADQKAIDDKLSPKVHAHVADDEEGPAAVDDTDVPELDPELFSQKPKAASAAGAHNEVYNALKFKLTSLRKAEDVETTKIPGGIKVFWKDENVYDWNDDDDNDVSKMPTGAAWNADQSAIAEVAKKFPDYQIMLSHEEDEFVSLTIKRKA